MSKPILCLDFDGVIHSYTSGWQGADVVGDPPVDGALIFIAKAVHQFEVHIFSSRSHQGGGKGAMQEWLRNAYMDDMEWGRDSARDFVHKTIKWPYEKPPAMVTLDDRAITFEGTWPEIETLLAFKPWNKRDV